PSQLVQDAARHNIEVRPVDALTSEWQCTLEQPDVSRPGDFSQPAIRLGFQRIKGFRQDAAERMIDARNVQPIRSLQDIARRARLDKGDMERLTEGGAFRQLSGHRYQTHWEAKGILSNPGKQPTEAIELEVAEKHQVYLPPPAETDDLRADYLSLGLTLGRHPMGMLRQQEPFTRLKTASDLTMLNHGRFVQVAGIVTGRQRPSSASGVLFLTLEDETDNINVVIWTRVLETYRAAVVQGRLLKIKGVMERQDSVIHVIAGHVEDLSHYLEHFLLKSRDFR
ncbi:MAG: error-prone DNA polymerase, partial [Candidatus Azotimanducaceae bacterium]